jgi:hypothetical protein
MLGASGTESNTIAGAFVRGMWSRLSDFKVSYATGTGGAEQCDATVPAAAPAAVDAQFWNLLAGADPEPERKASSMAFAVQENSVEAPGQGMWATDTDLIGSASGVGRGAVLQGVRFTTWGNGIQWENTASAVIAMAYYLRHFNADDEAMRTILTDKINAARDSLKHLLAVYGSVPASVRLDGVDRADAAVPIRGRRRHPRGGQSVRPARKVGPRSELGGQPCLLATSTQAAPAAARHRRDCLLGPSRLLRAGIDRRLLSDRRGHAPWLLQRGLRPPCPAAPEKRRGRRAPPRGPCGSEHGASCRMCCQQRLCASGPGWGLLPHG